VSVPPSDHALAAALVELLAANPAALARLRELVQPRVSTPSPALYTSTSLAKTIDVSPKAIRGAISRGELVATKRGGRWIISADAVQAWARSDRSGPRRRSVRTESRPLANALTLFDTGANPARRRL
jgi:hypothetical protein